MRAPGAYTVRRVVYPVSAAVPERVIGGEARARACFTVQDGTAAWWKNATSAKSTVLRQDWVCRVVRFGSCR